jgi:hypothetical protein
MAAILNFPAEICIQLDVPIDIIIGELIFVDELSPNWPFAFDPHTHKLPSFFKTAVKSVPALACIQVSPLPTTCTGRLLLVTLSCPNCPASLFPNKYKKLPVSGVGEGVGVAVASVPLGAGEDEGEGELLGVGGGELVGVVLVVGLGEKLGDGEGVAVGCVIVGEGVLLGVNVGVAVGVLVGPVPLGVGVMFVYTIPAILLCPAET